MTDEATAAAAEAAAAAAATEAAAGDKPAWHANYDPDTLGWMNNRGLDKLPVDEALSTAIKGHMNAEKSLGVPQERRIDLPADTNAPGALDGVYNRLGRPEAPDGYTFSSSDPEGTDKAFDDWAKTAFHDAGISAPNADALYTEFKNFVNGTVEQSAADAATAAAAAELDLQREWGPTYERNKNLATAAAAKFGLDADAFDAIRAALPDNQAMKLFQAIGAAVAEDPFVNSGGNEPVGQTPAGAAAEIKELQKDQGFVKLYLAGDKTSRDKMAALQKLATGGA
jgi:hypothetical protein